MGFARECRGKRVTVIYQFIVAEIHRNDRRFGPEVVTLAV